MLKNFKYFLFVWLMAALFFAMQTACKKEDKFPAQTLPDIIVVSPTSAIAGSPVHIKGKHLSDVTAVRFGIVTAVFSLVSDTLIEAIVPDSLKTGDAYVQVYVGDGVAYNAQKFTILPAPKIPFVNNVSPVIASPGDTITINGKNFNDVNAVTFNGTASWFHINDSTKLIAAIPGDVSNGRQTINVASVAGSDTASIVINLAPEISSFTPAQAKEGDVITVFGKRFTGVLSVKLGSLSTVFNLVDDNTIAFTVPASAKTSYIIITTSNGGTQSADEVKIIQ